MTAVGFPHSDIHGSIPACGFPWLFAAYRVLHRLLAPRHPPYALSSLTYSVCTKELAFLVFLVFSFKIAFLRGACIFITNIQVFFCFSLLCEVFKVLVKKNGGDERDRTADPLLARQVLSQLSYAPVFCCCLSIFFFILVGLSGLEPLTSRLSGVRSNQLSYRPGKINRRADASKPSIT